MKINFPARIFAGRPVPLPAHVGPVAAKLAKFKADDVVRVTIETEPKTRTLSQNARYWKLIVPAFSEWTGYEEFPESAERLGLAPKDSAHEVLKAMFVGEREALLPDGTSVKVRPSTAKLTVAEFADLQDRAERFLNQQGIYLPAEVEAA